MHHQRRVGRISGSRRLGGEPFFKIGTRVFRTLGDIFFIIGQLLVELLNPRAIRESGRENVRRMLAVVAVERRHRRVAEKCAELVKILLIDRIKLVIMALRALRGKAQPNG